MYKQAQEELLMAFDEALAYHSYTTFEKFIGADYIERCLKNNDTLRSLCQSYKQNHYIRYDLHMTYRCNKQCNKNSKKKKSTRQK